MFYWAKNHLGFTLTDEQFEDIPYPMAELITHVCIKNIQSFGLVSSSIVGPIFALSRAKTRSMLGVKQMFTKCGRTGAILGVVTGPLLTYAIVRKASDDAVWDRCYRIRRNRGQVRVDQWSIIGGATCAGVMFATGQGAVFGALLGINSGVLAAAYYNQLPKSEDDQLPKGEDDQLPKGEGDQLPKDEDA